MTGMEALEGRRMFAASVFDPTFGGGQASVSFVTLNSTVQSDGKVVVVGTNDYVAGSFTTFGLATDSRVEVARFGTDGLPDPTFNGGQPLILDPSGNDQLGHPVQGPSEATVVTTDPEGRLLISGLILNGGIVSQSNGNGDFLVPFLLRVTADGQRDSSFNAPIEALHDFNFNSPQEIDNGHLADYPYSIIVTGDNHVVVAGTSNLYNFTTLTNFNKLFLHGYDDAGTPDPTFTIGNENQDGLVTYDAPNLYDAFGLHAVYSPQEDAIYVGATSITPLQPFLLKGTSKGAAFPGFNFDNNFNYQPGVAEPSGGGDDVQSIAIQPDGKIVLAGVSGATSSSGSITAGTALGLARFLPNGDPDPTFGNGGVTAQTGLDQLQVRGLEVQNDGQIDVAATTLYNGTLNVAFLGAFNADGTLDTAFGTEGVAVTAISPGATPSEIFATEHAALAHAVATGEVPTIKVRPSASPAELFVSLGVDSSPDGTGALSVASGGQTVVKKVRFDHTAPAAVIAPGAGVSGAGAATYSFTVDYTDNDKMDAATLGNSAVMVAGPNGYSQAAALVGQSGSGRNLTASYQVAAPGGAWTAASNGSYTVTVQPDHVTDSAGNAVPSVAAQFLVNTSATPTPTPTPTQTPAQRVATDQIKLSADLQAQATTFAADRSTAALTATADKAKINADNAKVKADRHDRPALAQDKVQLAADKKQAHNDTVAANAKLKRDKASFAALIKADKAQLKVDQRLLKRSK